MMSLETLSSQIRCQSFELILLETIKMHLNALLIPVSSVLHACWFQTGYPNTFNHLNTYILPLRSTLLHTSLLRTPWPAAQPCATITITMRHLSCIHFPPVTWSFVFAESGLKTCWRNAKPPLVLVLDDPNWDGGLRLPSIQWKSTIYSPKTRPKTSNQVFFLQNSNIFSTSSKTLISCKWEQHWDTHHPSPQTRGRHWEIPQLPNQSCCRKGERSGRVMFHFNGTRINNNHS